MSKSAEELEREVEMTRSHMDRTVDALGAKMTPGQLLDEVVQNFRGSGGGPTLSSVGRQVREQPGALALLGVGLVGVGAGLVWLAMSAGRTRGYEAYDRYPDQPGEDIYSGPPGAPPPVRDDLP